MLNYNDLYEYSRKEKYTEQLQSLPKNFIQQFSEYVSETRKKFTSVEVNEFSDDFLKEKKQYENAFAIFKELMLRRKKKILNLVFVAAETGIMKRDFADMLIFERELFEKLVTSLNEADKSLTNLVNGNKIESANKMIMIKEDIEQFVSLSGEIIGPFKKGSLATLESQVADILVSGEKAIFVGED